MFQRIAIASASLALLLAASLGSHAAPTIEAKSVTPMGTEEKVLSELTSQQRELVAWGEDRFAQAGLPLPEVEYVFREDLEECGWHGGKYRPSTRTVTMCNTDPKTLLHELAHAWETTSLSDALREEFKELRGLSTWHHASVPWSQRGAEQVAEVIAWGLEEGSRLVRWVESDGDVNFRLFSIDATVDELLAAYELLTGDEPLLRDPTEWQPVELTDFSPEVARLST